jgi:hypothetical protein
MKIENKNLKQNIIKAREEAISENVNPFQKFAAKTLMPISKFLAPESYEETLSTGDNSLTTTNLKEAAPVIVGAGLGGATGAAAKIIPNAIGKVATGVSGGVASQKLSNETRNYFSKPEDIEDESITEYALAGVLGGIGERVGGLKQQKIDKLKNLFKDVKDVSRGGSTSNLPNLAFSESKNGVIQRAKNIITANEDDIKMLKEKLKNQKQNSKEYKDIAIEIEKTKSSLTNAKKELTKILEDDDYALMKARELQLDYMTGNVAIPKGTNTKLNPLRDINSEDIEIMKKSIPDVEAIGRTQTKIGFSKPSIFGYKPLQKSYTPRELYKSINETSSLSPRNRFSYVPLTTFIGNENYDQ